MGIKAEAALLARKEITFAEFYQRTRADWRRAADALLRRWEVPAAVTVEDVEQEMLMALVEKLPRWDASRSTAGEFAFFAARTNAGRWIHKQRSAPRQMGSSPSRCAKAISTLRKREDEDGMEVARMLDLVVEAPHDAIEFADLVRHVTEQLDMDDLLVFLTYHEAGCDERLAAQYLYADPDVRFMNEWGCERDAIPYVKQAVARCIEIAREIAA